MTTLTISEARRALSDMTLMDDAYFTKYFDGSTECASLMLSVLLGRKDLKVTKATTQKWIEGGDKRSVKLDIYARDGSGRIYDVEIQRAKRDGSARGSIAPCSMPITWTRAGNSRSFPSPMSS